jgi:hypothetical protein
MTEARLAGNAAFVALGRLFDYPNILRRPAGEILERFRAGGERLRAAWYVFMASGLLFTMVPLLLHPVLEAREVRWAGAVNALGYLAFSAWLVVVGIVLVIGS